MECHDTVWINCVEDVLGHECNLYNTSSEQFTHQMGQDILQMKEFWWVYLVLVNKDPFKFTIWVWSLLYILFYSNYLHRDYVLGSMGLCLLATYSKSY